jgi:hypothetical protein
VTPYAGDVLRRPEGWQVAHQAELFGQESRVLAREPHVLVYAGDERLRHPLGIRPVSQPLTAHPSAIQEETGRPVLLDEGRTEDLREQPKAPPSPEIYLPQAVPRGVETLSEKGIVGGGSVDVGHPPAVDEDLDRRLWTAHGVGSGLQIH